MDVPPGMEEFYKDFHPEAKKYITGGRANEDLKWVEHFAINDRFWAVECFRPWRLDNITEGKNNTHGNSGLNEMCEVYEGFADDKVWYTLIICKMCHEIVKENARVVPEDGGSDLLTFQVHMDTQCRAQAMLTEADMVIDENILIDTGHRRDCTCGNPCYNGGSTGEDDEG